MSEPSGPRAGFWIRVLAVLLDSIVLMVVGAVLNSLLGIGDGWGAADQFRGVGILVNLLYFGWFEGGPAGQTPGKKLVGIRVIRFDTGGPLGWGKAMLRYLASILSGIVIGLGYLWMLWDREKQTWHDKLTETVVVPARAYPPAPGSFGKSPSSPREA
jgi:uncharacterized RDD family membrane protein YckC